MQAFMISNRGSDLMEFDELFSHSCTSEAHWSIQLVCHVAVRTMGSNSPPPLPPTKKKKSSNMYCDMSDSPVPVYHLFSYFTPLGTETFSRLACLIRLLTSPMCCSHCQTRCTLLQLVDTPRLWSNWSNHLFLTSLQTWKYFICWILLCGILPHTDIKTIYRSFYRSGAKYGHPQFIHSLI